MICLVLTIFANLFPAACTGAHERTFLAVKPDGVQRRLVGEIVRRFERKGFKLVALKLVQASEELLREHYAELRERPFYGRLVKYMASGPVVAMVSTWEAGGRPRDLHLRVTPPPTRPHRYGRGWTWCAPRGRSSGRRTRPTPSPAPSAGISALRLARTSFTAATQWRVPAERSLSGSAQRSSCAGRTVPGTGCMSSPVGARRRGSAAPASSRAQAFRPALQHFERPF
ncbi:nucleoside diphosphate kinase 3 isoform X1 [Saimiri boliviensis]|uniref:nucleoside diphosphate kinase 3 isoform X1 n=1 Tax=Saimiri boliviensis TaxID=27679 RepID=UPI000533F2F5|nr:nucleoside diphosphate kinase 3 isoform X1 [Saimiri boliviensis boliviensis]